ncbi:unnamed protein product [Linum trigynum]|uniref:Uncharacterized protein n=1 Tax=Linum trigynum TaxID=586398 RepID=A0AAV2EVD0_9ROSI
MEEQMFYDFLMFPVSGTAIKVIYILGLKVPLLWDNPSTTSVIQEKKPLYIRVHQAQLVQGILGRTPKSKTVLAWPKADNIVLIELPGFDKWYQSLVRRIWGGGCQFGGTLIRWPQDLISAFV